MDIVFQSPVLNAGFQDFDVKKISDFYEKKKNTYFYIRNIKYA